MTFTVPIILLLAGLAMFAGGLFGKEFPITASLTIPKIESGIVRVVAMIIGLGLVIFSIYTFEPELIRPTPSEIPTPSKTPQPAISSIYTVTVHTGDIEKAGTNAGVFITLYGSEGKSDEIKLDTKNYNDHERGAVDSYDIHTADDLGELKYIYIRHNNQDEKPGWFLDRVSVENLAISKKWDFPCKRWLARTAEDGKISRTIYLDGRCE